MPDEKIIIGDIKVDAGQQTQERFSFHRALGRCVVTELYADWSLSTSDEDIQAFLYSGRRKLGLPPTPNYRLYYGGMRQTRAR